MPSLDPRESLETLLPPTEMLQKWKNTIKAGPVSVQLVNPRERHWTCWDTGGGFLSA